MGYILFWSVILALGALGTVISVNRHRFEKDFLQISAAMEEQIASLPARAHELIPLEELPPPVQRYLQAVIKRETPLSGVHLSHRGQMRPSPSSPWFPIRGRQYLRAETPEFVWWGRLRLIPGIWIDVRDSFRAGKGRMLVKFASSWTLNDAEGAALSESAQLRMLAEMFWLPSSFRDRRYLEWEALTARTARAHFRIEGRSVSADFHFDSDDLIDRVSTQRYRRVGDQDILTPWSGLASDYREVDGLLLPFRVEAIWHLEEGDFECIRFEVETIAFSRSKGAKPGSFLGGEFSEEKE